MKRAIVVAGIVGAALLAAYVARPVPRQTTQVQSPVVQAQDRQKLLEDLTRDTRLTSFDDVVKSVVYDSNFDSYEQELRRLVSQGIREGNSALIEVVTRDLQSLPQERKQPSYAITLPEGKVSFKGKKSTIYVGADFFDKLNNRDDRVSVLSHENRHAKVHKYGLPLPLQVLAELNGAADSKRAAGEINDLVQTYDEACAYGFQLRDAFVDKKYALSDHFAKQMESQFVLHRSKLKNTAREQTLRGRVAKGMYDGLPLKRND